MSASRKSIVKNIRVSESTLHLIERAASLRGDNFTQFVLNSARAQAQMDLLDRNFFVLDAEEFDRVDALIDEPHKKNGVLEKLLQEGKSRRAARQSN